MIIRHRSSFDPAVIERLALGTGRVVLDPELIAELAANRSRVLTDLTATSRSTASTPAWAPRPASAWTPRPAPATRTPDDRPRGRLGPLAAPRPGPRPARRTPADPAAPGRGVSPELWPCLIDLLDADVVRRSRPGAAAPPARSSPSPTPPPVPSCSARDKCSAADGKATDAGPELPRPACARARSAPRRASPSSRVSPADRPLAAGRPRGPPARTPGRRRPAAAQAVARASRDPLHPRWPTARS